MSWPTLAKLRRVAKWSMLAVCALLLISWPLSECWWISWRLAYPNDAYQVVAGGPVKNGMCLSMAISNGRFAISKYSSRSRIGFRVGPVRRASNAKRHWWPRFHNNMLGVWTMSMPLWCLFMVAMIPTGFLWVADAGEQRSFAPGEVYRRKRWPTAAAVLGAIPVFLLCLMPVLIGSILITSRFGNVVTDIIYLVLTIPVVLYPTVRAFQLLRWKKVINDGSICPICDYDLTGNESGVCPECGTVVDPTLNLG